MEKKVLIISNEVKECLFYHHQSFPVAWDYHIIMLIFKSDWSVCDLDSSLRFPCPLGLYLSETFQDIHPGSESGPKFLVLEGSDFLARFSSDRSHMIKKDGTWMAPPPEWPMITNHYERYELKFLMDFDNHKSKILSVNQLKEIFT